MPSEGSLAEDLVAAILAKHSVSIGAALARRVNSTQQSVLDILA